MEEGWLISTAYTLLPVANIGEFIVFLHIHKGYEDCLKSLLSLESKNQNFLTELRDLGFATMFTLVFNNLSSLSDFL